MGIKADDKAPDFELPDENGIVHRLSNYRGKWVVLYFYPKDNTPGCTIQACTFRDDYSAYQENDVVILGISPDSPKSHAGFKDKHHLPFTLLADENHQVCQLYGVWGKKKMLGREYDGVFRTTFLIDKDGVVKRVFEKVKPTDNSAEVLAEIRA